MRSPAPSLSKNPGSPFRKRQRSPKRLSLCICCFFHYQCPPPCYLNFFFFLILPSLLLAIELLLIFQGPMQKAPLLALRFPCLCHSSITLSHPGLSVPASPCPSASLKAGLGADSTMSLSGACHLPSAPLPSRNGCGKGNSCAASFLSTCLLAPFVSIPPPTPFVSGTRAAGTRVGPGLGGTGAPPLLGLRDAGQPLGEPGGERGCARPGSPHHPGAGTPAGRAHSFIVPRR